MHFFKDDTGHEWQLSISIGSARKVKRALKIDIVNGDPNETIKKVCDNLYDFCNVLYHLLKDQIKAAGLDEESFAERLYGNTIERASTAYTNEMISFFRNPNRRLVAKKAMESLEELEEMNLNLLNKSLEDQMKEARSMYGDILKKPLESSDTPESIPPIALH